MEKMSIHTVAGNINPGHQVDIVLLKECGKEGNLWRGDETRSLLLTSKRTSGPVTFVM